MGEGISEVQCRRVKSCTQLERQTADREIVACVYVQRSDSKAVEKLLVSSGEVGLLQANWY